MAEGQALAIVDNGHGWAVLAGGAMQVGGFPSEQAALDYWFDANRVWKTSKIGYPVAWITDGAVYCADCAKSFWLAGGEDRARLASGEIAEFLYQDSTVGGLSCANCDAWIEEPSCLSCGKLDSECPNQFQNENGEGFICMDCLAAAVVNAKTLNHRAPVTAEKTGKRTYDVFERHASARPGVAPTWTSVGAFGRDAFNEVERRLDEARGTPTVLGPLGY